MIEFEGYTPEEWKLKIMRKIRDPNIYLKVFTHVKENLAVATVIQQIAAEDDYVHFQTSKQPFIIDVIIEATLYVYLEDGVHR